jgi:hypothetical protein
MDCRGISRADIVRKAIQYAIIRFRQNSGCKSSSEVMVLDGNKKWMTDSKGEELLCRI